MEIFIKTCKKIEMCSSALELNRIVSKQKMDAREKWEFFCYFQIVL